MLEDWFNVTLSSSAYWATSTVTSSIEKEAGIASSESDSSISLASKSRRSVDSEFSMVGFWSKAGLSI